MDPDRFTSISMKTLRLLLLFVCALPAFGQTTVPQWRAHTPLPEALVGHRAILLPTGEVLVTGGIGNGGAATTSSLLYSPSDNSIRPTLNPLAGTRAYHALVAVPGASGSARIFAIGGYEGSAGAYRSVATVEMLEFVPASSNWRWRTIGRLGEGRGDCAAAWDGGSFIIVAGGRAQTSGALRSGSRLSSAERIDLARLVSDPIGPMSGARSEHVLARYIDQANIRRVLAAGGESTTATTATELLAATTWDQRANPPILYHADGITVSDPAGVARVFGGFDAAAGAINQTEWYDPKSGWRFGPRMTTPRASAEATLVAGVADSASIYLVVAGQGRSGALRETEIFSLPDGSDPNGTWSPFLPLIEAGVERTASITGSNLALVTGGSRAGAPTAGAEIFQPLRANDTAFGSVEVGRTSDSLPITITNEWLLPVSIRNVRLGGSAEFTFSGDTTNMRLSPDRQRRLFVRFRPNGVGERRGMLLFDVGSITDTVILRGVGLQSSLEVTTANVAFDSVLLGDRKQLCFDALKNNGSAPAEIDSISLGAGPYRLVSPLGRTTILPGETLRVCVEFLPSERGEQIESMNIHLAARAFPIGISGVGTRRFLLGSTSGFCDTVAFAPGVTSTGFITLENRGDVPATISTVNFTASVAGIFAVENPADLPLTLAPGASRFLAVRYAPQREGVEQGTADLVNNGDTAVKVSLCFVARSRFIAPSLSSLDFGAICAGDTAVRSFLLENPGGLESVRLDSVVRGTGSGDIVVVPVASTVLAPRQTVGVTVRVAPQTAGPFTGEVVVHGAFGSVTVPVSGLATPSVKFTPRALSAAPADRIILPVDLDASAGATVSDARLLFQYDRSLLYPRRLVRLDGGSLDESRSTVTITRPGEANLAAVWSAPVTSSGPAFGIECEVLRGDDDESAVRISGGADGALCFRTGISAVEVEGPCGGESGFVRTSGVALARIAPNPASDRLSVVVISAMPGTVRLELADGDGRIVLVREPGEITTGSLDAEIDLRELSSGIYHLRVAIGSVPVDMQSVVIRR